jgi:hypothetical protein
MKNIPAPPECRDMEVTMRPDLLKLPRRGLQGDRGFLEAFFPAPGKIYENLKAYEL